jgi:hypothetical protein
MHFKVLAINPHRVHITQERTVFIIRLLTFKYKELVTHHPNNKVSYGGA